MVCKTMKKGILGAALTAGALYLAFGTSAPSYVKTAFHKVRQNVKHAVPIQFEIDRAREDIASLEPAIKDTIEQLARQEEEVKFYEGDIVSFKANMSKQEGEILALRDTLKTGDFKLTGNLSYSPEELQTDLGRRLDSYKRCEGILVNKESTLKSKQKGVIALRTRLNEIGEQKRSLAVKVDEIEARLKAMEATKTYDEFNFDDSALARAKKTVAELDKELNIIARTDELKGRYSDPSVRVIAEPKRDVVKEIDAKFGPSVKKTSEKSL